MNPYEEEELMNMLEEYIDEELSQMGYWSISHILEIAKLAGLEVCGVKSD